MLEARSLVEGAALVTGASRGIGRVIASRLAALGVPVAVNYRESHADADDLVRWIERQGQMAVALQADLSIPSEAAALFATAEDRLGQIGLIVNNAGATRDRLLIQMTENDWEAIWATNLAGMRALSRPALAAMCARRRGRIVNISSVVGAAGNAGQSNYAAAKSAVLGLTRALAVEAAPFGVTVNCVVPGYIATDATAHLTEEQRHRWLDRIPMGRYATPEEVSDIVVFLAGHGASYITGQCIAVDGGFQAAAGAGLAS